MAEVYIKLQDFNQATLLLKQAVSINANSIYFEALGKTYARQNLFIEAEQQFKLAVGIAPYNTHIHYSMSEMYQQWGKATEATLEREVGTEVQHPPARTGWPNNDEYRQLRKEEEAGEGVYYWGFWKQYSYAHVRLGDVYRRHGRYSYARKKSMRLP